jgi:hypothetical protein
MVWRLALSALSFDDVLCGPSNSSTTLAGFSVRGDEGLSDDQLTEVELDLICGAYVCYTGKLSALCSPAYLTGEFRLRKPDRNQVVVSARVDV